MITDNESRGICAKTAYKNRLSARTVFPILRRALGGEGRLGKVAGEQQSRQQEGGAQSGVEKCDELVRGHAAGPQPDVAGHHHRHDEGLHIEKLEEEVQPSS